MYILKDLEPKGVFKFFEEISRIPHGSGNEKGISDYLMNFANDRGLWAYRDDLLNVLIKKPGTPGYENAPTCILQGHMDMVNEKNSGSAHDFLKDPLKLVIDGDYILAEGTTLGADDGVAMAYALELLDRKDIPHPPLEVLMTSGEEIGLIGAAAFDEKLLEGKILLNLDSEDEGVFWQSCAGGLKTQTRIKKEMIVPPDGLYAFEIKISGLKGGHSGIDIDKERANSVRLAARLLQEASGSFNIYLADINGGAKSNAIPRECSITVLADKKEKFIEFVLKYGETISAEYAAADPDIKISCAEKSMPEHVFDGHITEKIITACLLIPNGVQAMSTAFEGIVETSNNIGVIETGEDEITISCAVRSSVESRKKFVAEQIALVSKKINAAFDTSGDYPAWEYNPDSKIKFLIMKTYESMYNKPAKFNAVHAGLECSYFSKKLPFADMVSFGPDMSGIHSPDERLSIPSVKRVWELLLEVLKQLTP